MNDDLPRPEIRKDARPVPAIFTFPNRILFGEGARTHLAAELARLGVARPLVVTDRGLVASGLVDEVVGIATIGGRSGVIRSRPPAVRS